MPYIANQNLSEEEKRKQLEQAGQSGFGISGESTSFNQAQSNNQPEAPKPQKQSGSWTNLNQYLDANKASSADMGNKIADNVESQATKANEGINSLKAAAPGVLNSINADDWFAKPDASRKAEYGALKNSGGYNGPQSVDGISGYSDTLANVNKADTQVKNAGSETGRFNLLQQTYDRPQYSQGLKKLDNVLLQQNTDSKARFEQLGNKYKGILDTFNNESTNIGNNINSNIQTATQNKNNLVAAEASAKKNLFNPIQARAAEQNQKNPETINRVNADLSDDTLSQETLDLLGLSDGQSLYDINLNSYVNPDLTQVGVDNVANAEERAKYAALAAMTGDDSMSQLTANGKSIAPVTFNKDQFGKDIAGKKAEYDNQYNNQKIYNGGAGDLTPAQVKQGIAEYREYAKEPGMAYYYGRKADEMQAAYDNWESNFQVNRRVSRG